MSKKQETIINGIDVSECEYINCCSEEAKCIILQDDILSDSQYCKSEPNCYFKQFKRLQEENEELKKRQITKNGFICDCEENEKYKQALEKIREILMYKIYVLKEHASQLDYMCYVLDKFEKIRIKILTKINEVLNDRD